MKERPFVPAVLLVVAFLAASRLGPNFMDARYLLESTTLYMEAGLLALAMTFLIVSGNIDLSVGSTLVLCGCVAAKLLESGSGFFPTFLLTVLLGTGIGALNGFVVAKFRLPSFLVTLATMAIGRGAAQAMLGPSSVKLPLGFKGIDQSTLLGLPWPLVIFLGMAVIAGLLLHRTVFGRWVFGLGTNERAALYSGIPIDRVKITVFAMAGLMAALGALLIDSRLGVARYDLAKGIELDAITVAVLGGAAIQGGRGSILGTTLSLFLIMVLKTAMGVSNVKAEYQLTAIGALLILAVVFGNLSTLRRRVRKTPSAESA